MKKKKFYLPSFLLVLIAAVLFFFHTPAPNTLAPDFTLPEIGTDRLLTLSEQRGRVVVLNFWGSWCAPCREEAPLLQSTYAAYAERGVLFIGVAIDDTTPQALDYIAAFGITYPNVIDTQDEMEALYNIYGIPVTLVLDKQGRVSRMFFSQPSAQALRRAIEDAL